MRLGLPSRLRGRRVPASLVALAVVSYVPLLLTHRTMVGADTKTYLYLDPAKLLARAPYLWEPGVGLGTVTHQNIGYLWPMGPYYWLMDTVGVPDWIAQRLWMGSIIFLAGVGVRVLLKELRWDGPGIGLASFAYALSPYLLHYVYKHSVILLPFTALPWLITFAARALRRGGWRWPAAFALVTVTAGGVNATSLLLVLLGPALWLLHAWLIEHEVRWTKVVGVAWRVGLLTVVTSVWWVAGLTLQGSNGIDVLRYTETYKTVADASTAVEVFRGFGYWFFYGTDILGPWFNAAVTYTQALPALALSFAVPILGVASALLTRFRYQLFFVGLAIAGLVLSVGAHPWDDSSIYGSAYRELTRTDAGLAMRSTPRAIPLLALALAVFLAAGTSVVYRAWPRYRWVTIGLAYLLVVANLSPLWMGRMVDEFLEHPSEVPEYWEEAGRRLDSGDSLTRAIEVPGIEFANYRWGASVDPITPGLTDRDLSARELVPWGSPASADLTNAIDAGFQDGTIDPAALVPLFRLAGIGDVVARNDLEYERFRTPRPRVMRTWLDLAGLGPIEAFGPSTPNRAVDDRPLIDEIEEAIPPTTPDPAAVEIRPVPDPLPVLRSVPSTTPTVLAGDGQGIVSTAEAGRLDPTRLLQYSGTVSDDEPALDQLLEDGAELVVTDTNRKAARRWGAVRENDGYTEEASEVPREDVSDNRLDLFPGREDDPSIHTVTEQRGGWRARASSYGNELTYTPGDRPTLAMDGDPRTAWKVGAFSDVRDDWLQLTSDHDVTTDRIRVVQPLANSNRFITRVRLSFDRGAPVDVDLSPASRTGSGQELTFPSRTFRSVRLTVRATDPGPQRSYRGVSGVGFAEVDVDGRHITEVVRPPTDLLDATGERSAEHRVEWILRRRRGNPAEPGLAPEERRMIRDITSPVARGAMLSGTARLSPTLADDTVDAMLGAPGAGAGGLTLTSSSRPFGDLSSRASKALDGADDTAWQSRLVPQPGEFWQVQFPRPSLLTLSSLHVIDDRKHSLPATIHVEVDGVPGPTIPVVHADPTPGRDGHVRELNFQPQVIGGSTIRIVVDSFVERSNPDWLSGTPTGMPLGLAEIGLTHADGAPIAAPVPAEQMSTGCRGDLVDLDDASLEVEVSGASADAELGRPLTLTQCGATVGGVPLIDGSRILSTTDGATSGIDVDQLVLDSAAVRPPAAPPLDTAAPQLEVDRPSRVAYDIAASASSDPYWLVLGQSLNDGWHLTADGQDLGAPVLVNGFANGWRIDPAVVGEGPVSLELRWTPQRMVWVALAISALGLLVCLALVLVPRFARQESPEGPRPPLRPLGIVPWDAHGPPVRPMTAAIATAGVTAVTAFLVTPWWALAVGALTALALVTRWGWLALRALALGLLAGTALFVIGRQWRNELLVDFDWPLQFEAVARLPLVAFACIGADAVVEALRAGWRRISGL